MVYKKGSVNGSVRSILMTNLTCVSFIPLIISANLLLIFRIFKTKRNKLSSSQILFLVFLNDFIFGVFHLPTEIYFKWKSNCFETELAKFCSKFPKWMPVSNLFVISIDLYMSVVHNRFI